MMIQGNTIATTLTSALQHLLGERTQQGHWGDIRSSALAAWALGEVLASQNSSERDLAELRGALKDSLTWLTGQARREEGGVSWESEVWDTALTVIALSFDDTFAERLDQATAWLQRIRDPRSGVWYDEVWETTLATIALLRRERVRVGPENHDLRWLEAVLNWIIHIPSKPSGEFVSPHYSGFLCWLFGEIQRSRVPQNVRESKAFQEFAAKAKAAHRWLVLRLDDASSTQLWSRYTFSNAYITYALLMFPESKLDQLTSGPIPHWFSAQQGKHGGYEDAEDTALAVLALSGILESAERERMLRGLAKTGIAIGNQVQRYFLGYSSGSKAIALEIKEFLSHFTPTLLVRDWVWDFQPGHLLFAEIDDASKECQIAIFLVTKDDETNYLNGGSHATPRDNIVFEVGFFAARIGIENTILIVESGAKIPTDWGGILYIPLRDRNELANVTMSLLRVLERLKRRS